jgi:hypothetical protein
MASADPAGSVTVSSPFQDQTHHAGNGAVTITAARTLDGIGKREASCLAVGSLAQYYTEYDTDEDRHL